MNVEPEEIRSILARIAGEAAAYLRDRLGLPEYLHVVSRSRRDETLGIDYEVESFIIDLVRAEGLEARIVSEERGEVIIGKEPLLTLLLDPLDGSKNYASFIPWAAVSIAAIRAKGDTATIDDIVAAAVAPVSGWPVISFSKTGGVREGEASPLKTPTPRLLLYYAENSAQASIVEEFVRAFRERGYRVSTRSYGAAALEVTWAALGRALAFIDFRGKLRNIDVAAALGIARAAGAYIYLEKSVMSVRRVEEIGSIVVAPPATSHIVKEVLEKRVKTANAYNKDLPSPRLRGLAD